MDKVQTAAALFTDEYSLSGLLGTPGLVHRVLLEVCPVSRDAGCPSTP